MFTGKAYITNNVDIIAQAMNDPMTRIILLEDINDFQNLDQSKFIIGSYLLPPMEAKMAEADGDEMRYDYFYSNHLSTEYSKIILAAILAFIYQGGTIIFFLPDDYYDNTREKFVQHISMIYGIHIGILYKDQNDFITNSKSEFDSQFIIDPNKIPVMLDLIYLFTNTISWKEYLFNFPSGIRINKVVMDKILNDMKPYGENYEDQINYVYYFMERIKRNIKSECPLRMEEK